RLELTVEGKTVVAELLPGGPFQLECPNGTTYSTSFDTLFTCQPPSRAPTDSFDVMSNSFMFTLSSVSTPSPLFTCTQ
ncbi:MAG: hypothetical protein JWO36_3901, partial [Myxococcales bacterium]|nr:hypothetical protein [Myxococcales bacterium]